MKGSKVAGIVIGISCSWIDLLTYVAGIGIVLMVEKYRPKKELTAATDHLL